MKGRRIIKYRLRIDDESRLETRVDITLSPWGLALSGAAAVAVLFLLAALLIMVTPLRTLLPGYLKESERSATEDNIMRLDSIRSAHDLNQAYLASIMRAMDTDRPAVDTTAIPVNMRALSPDSLLPSSAAEQKFINAMEEREKYNISVLAPLAADGMMFTQAADGSVFSMASRSSMTGEILLADDSPVRAVADGSILASYYSPSDSGYVIIIQHNKGFVTRLAHTGAPMVTAGDVVTAGQVVAAAPAPDARRRRTLTAMMWHNGMPVAPYDYIGDTGAKTPKEQPFEAPRGR